MYKWEYRLSTELGKTQYNLSVNSRDAIIEHKLEEDSWQACIGTEVRTFTSLNQAQDWVESVLLPEYRPSFIVCVRCEQPTLEANLVRGVLRCHNCNYEVRDWVPDFIERCPACKQGKCVDCSKVWDQPEWTQAIVMCDCTHDEYNRRQAEKQASKEHPRLFPE